MWYKYKIPKIQCLTLLNFTTPATNGASIYDQEDMMTGYHEDSDVPQQCARARSLLFFCERNKKNKFTFGVQNDFFQGLWNEDYIFCPVTKKTH